MLVSLADAQVVRRRPPTYYVPVAAAPAVITLGSIDSSSNWENQATGRTFTATVDTNSNRYLVVGFVGRVGSDAGLVDSVYIDGTGGGKLAALVEKRWTGSSESMGCALFGIKAAQSGERTVTIYTHGDGIYGGAGSVNLYNVNQTTPTGTTANTYSYSNAPAVAITNTTGYWVIDAVNNNEGRTYTAGTNQTVCWRRGMYSHQGAMSWKSATGTGTAWTMNTNGTWSIVAVVINPL